MGRFAFLLVIALTAPLAQATNVDRALGCVQAAMTSLQPLGATPEQLAPIALARCFDEIEAALANAKEAARIALRRELYDYALHVTGGAHAYDGVSAVSLEQRSF